MVKPEILTFKIKFYLEGQGQLPPKTEIILTNAVCTSGPNLVILAWIGEELCCGQSQNGFNFDFRVNIDHKQVIDIQTDRHADTGNDKTWRPKLTLGKNSIFCVMHWLFNRNMRRSVYCCIGICTHTHRTHTRYTYPYTMVNIFPLCVYLHHESRKAIQTWYV